MQIYLRYIIYSDTLYIYGRIPIELRLWILL